VHLILKATALVLRAAPVQTVIVGTGKDQEEFRDLARRLELGPAAVFTGLVPEEDLPHLYCMGDVYIGAGAAELQGMAVMEAMAAGLPVLAADAVALPELVRDGHNGYLFALDPHSLADAMLKMLSQRESWPVMGARNLADIQVHDSHQVLAQVEDLYREVIASRRLSPVG
jgi:1,2-diacylglycerol 3-alpha-glucosyltransferase